MNTQHSLQINQNRNKPLTIRRFYLENENGVRLNLNDVDKHFFQNPTGLGMSKSLSYTTSGDGFFGISENSRNQINPVGDMVFVNDPYTAYTEFVEFVTKADSLVLVYAPQGDGEFLLDVELEYITKTEVKDGVLTCPISFKALSLWYRKTPTVYKIVQGRPIPNPKKYPYKYSYAYSIETDSARTLKAKGHIPAALEIFVKGKLTSPVLELRKKSNNALIGRMQLENLTVNANTWLKLSSKYNGGAGVWVGGNDVTRYINLADNSFFRLPQNTPCVLTVSDENYSNATVWVYIYEYYLTV